MWDIVVRDMHGREMARATLANGSLSVGRAPDNELVVKDAAMSRHHARLELREGRPWIIDMGSVNGVLVDGQKIDGPHLLDPRMRADLSGFMLQVIPKGQQAVDIDRVTQVVRPVDIASILDGLDEQPEADQSADTGRQRPAAPVAPEQESTATRLLEQKINSIRSHRETQSSAREEKTKAFENEWQEVLNEMRQLRARLRDDDRVRYFAIARDDSSAAVKIMRGSSQTSLLMSRGHPDRTRDHDHRIYVRDHVWPDKSFTSPRDAMNDFLSQVASLLA